MACRLLLGIDREIYNYTTAVIRQRSVKSNTGKVLSVRSVPRYKEYELASILGAGCTDNPP